MRPANERRRYIYVILTLSGNDITNGLNNIYKAWSMTAALIPV